MINILVLCTGNSCRSQIAHGYLEAFSPKGIQIYSAGVETHDLNSIAVDVMKDDEIDISSNTSNHIDEYFNVEFDFIITVCDHAKETCPYYQSNAHRFHCHFPDPSKAKGKTQEIKRKFELTRDLIKVYCKEFITAYL